VPELVDGIEPSEHVNEHLSLAGRMGVNDTLGVDHRGGQW
jgi:hypothetical protein